MHFIVQSLPVATTFHAKSRSESLNTEYTLSSRNWYHLLTVALSILKMEIIDEILKWDNGKSWWKQKQKQSQNFEFLGYVYCIADLIRATCIFSNLHQATHISLIQKRLWVLQFLKNKTKESFAEYFYSNSNGGCFWLMLFLRWVWNIWANILLFKIVFRSFKRELLLA